MPTGMRRLLRSRNRRTRNFGGVRTSAALNRCLREANTQGKRRFCYSFHGPR